MVTHTIKNQKKISNKISNSTGNVTIYESPEKSKTDIQIFVNDYSTPVYETSVNNSHVWSKTPQIEKTPITYFDFSGIVTVKIVLSNDARNVIVRPLNSNIIPIVEGKNISFTISQAGTYTVEYNDSVKRAIHIFANETLQIPEGKVCYISPGIHEESIIASDDEIIYIAGGAIVRGQIIVNNVKNVTICGRGIIDGSVFDSWIGYKELPQINANNSSNLKIDGIIFLDSNCWALNLWQCNNVSINNIKIITARPNGDGISLQSCSSVYISNSFVRTWDDSLVVKNYSSVNSHDIHFKRIQVWTDLAQSCEIGYETNKSNVANSEIYDISFNDITILHNFHKPVISIHNSDDAWIHKISFNNIIIEDAEMGNGDAKNNNQLIDLVIAYNFNWSSTKQRGKISDVIIKNVKVIDGKFPPSRIYGYDNEHKICNINIKNIEILGQKILDVKHGLFDVNEFVSNITFE